MENRFPRGVEIHGSEKPGFDKALTKEALEFLVGLHRRFDPIRLELLEYRRKRQTELDEGKDPDFLPQTASVRTSLWEVNRVPGDLQDRRVEITGPTDAKMMVNALNSGAKIFMADCEDSLSPTWENVVQGQLNLIAAVRHELRHKAPDGKEYLLNPQVATLLVRPRGWHLIEKHVLVDGKPLSASLFDFGLYFFHNAQERLNRGTAPYFYLPKLESHLEARLWNDVFNFAQDDLGIARGTIRATVLIETILAAFEMEEILYELKDHICGLNAGRWDYIFSVIKKFRNRKGFVLPDRGEISMTVPFMRAYAELLVKTCHKRGAHAIGGMSAFIPNRKDPVVTERALAKVREDKKREATDGFDGTWVAHPDLVSVAMKEFDDKLGRHPHQKNQLRSEVRVSAGALLNFIISGAKITEIGVRQNVSVALQYLERWLGGTGAAAIFNLMEDAATAEISRAQLWQWRKNSACLDDGRVVSGELYQRIRDDELNKLGGAAQGGYGKAVELLDSLVLSDKFSEFLTVPAYQYLEEKNGN